MRLLFTIRALASLYDDVRGDRSLFRMVTPVTIGLASLSKVTCIVLLDYRTYNNSQDKERKNKDNLIKKKMSW